MPSNSLRAIDLIVLYGTFLGGEVRLRRKWKLPLFYRYLLSYVIVLGLPVVIMGITGYLHFIHIIKEQSFESNRKMLEQVRDIVDTKYREFTSIAGQVSSYPNLFSASIYDPMAMMQIRNQLNYSTGNEFIQELLFYVHNSSYIYSEQSTYPVSIFQDLYHFDGWSPEDTLSRIDGIRRPTLIASSSGIGMDNERFLVYMVPIPLNAKQPKATLMFFIREHNLQNLLVSLFKYEDSNTIVLDESGNVITSLQSINEIQLAIMKYTARLERPENETVSKVDDKYDVTSVRSTLTGWTYITIVPNDELMKEANIVRDRALYTFGIVFIVGILFIYLGMRLNYKPLKQLVRFTEAKWGLKLQQAEGIDKIRMFIEQSEQVQQQLRDKAETAVPALRQHLLTELLRGKYQELEPFNADGRELGVSLHRGWVQVAIIELLGHVAAPEPFGALTRLGDNLPSDYKLYTVNLVEGLRQVWIVSADGENRLSEEQWLGLQRNLIDITDVHVTIGVGNICKKIDQLSTSFIEASSALHYSAVKGKNKVVFFQETLGNEKEDRSWYPEQELYLMQAHLLRRETAEAMQIASRIVNRITSNSNTLFVATYLCMETWNMILRTLQDIFGSQSRLNPPVPDVLALTEVQTSEELGRIVLEVCAYACRELDGKQAADQEQELSKAMLGYIQEHGLNYDFTVQSMSEKLAWSPSHLRKIFKESTGMTISDYVNHLRMDKAKQLLKNNDRSLQEIVQQLGYSDVSSFIRKFKQETSMTPGEYRNSYAQK